MEVEDIGQEEVETAIYGDGWIRESQVDRKATERVYVGWKDIERVEDGPDNADKEEECGWT